MGIRVEVNNSIGWRKILPILIEWYLNDYILYAAFANLLEEVKSKEQKYIPEDIDIAPMRFRETETVFGKSWLTLTICRANSHYSERLKFKILGATELCNGAARELCNGAFYIYV